MSYSYFNVSAGFVLEARSTEGKINIKPGESNITNASRNSDIPISGLYAILGSIP